MGRRAVFVLTVMAGFGLATEPPIVGRPAEYSGAIGGPFIVTMNVDHRTITVEQPFTLTLRVVGAGNLKDMSRPPLAKSKAMEAFAIDDLDDTFTEGPPPSRTFRYRLRPRSAEANRIPPFKFVYFNPAIMPPSRGYQTTFADAVALEVKEPAPIAATKSDLPQRIFELRQRIAANADDTEAWHQLAELRKEVRYPMDELRPRESQWPIRLTLAQNWAIALGLTVIASAALRRWWRSRRHLELIAAIVAFSFALFPAIGVMSAWRERTRNEEWPVVVVAQETPLRRGNGDEYPNRIDSLLPAGAEVRRLHERNGWLQVELANGVVGWVPAESVIQ